MNNAVDLRHYIVAERSGKQRQGALPQGDKSGSPYVGAACQRPVAYELTGVRNACRCSALRLARGLDFSAFRKIGAFVHDGGHTPGTEVLFVKPCVVSAVKILKSGNRNGSEGDNNIVGNIKAFVKQQQGNYGGGRQNRKPEKCPAVSETRD